MPKRKDNLIPMHRTLSEVSKILNINYNTLLKWADPRVKEIGFPAGQFPADYVLGGHNAKYYHISTVIDMIEALIGEPIEDYIERAVSRITEARINNNTELTPEDLLELYKVLTKSLEASADAYGLLVKKGLCV